MRAPRKLKTLRILLAEDDPDSRVLCTRILERFGHRVTAVREGLEAIGLLGEREWDVVLADQNMPGASGIDVLERAFHIQPRALRLLMSDLIDPRTKEEALTRARAQAFIEKPVSGAGLDAVEAPGPAEFEVRYVLR